MRQLLFVSCVVCISLAVIVPTVATSQTVLGPVIYTPSMESDSAKLSACYALIEDMIGEYNRQSQLAGENTTKYEAKFRQYAMNEYTPRLKALLGERDMLKSAILADTYSRHEWAYIWSLGLEKVDEIEREVFGNKTADKLNDTSAVSVGLVELSGISLDDMTGLIGGDPTEDFTTYTEYDEGDDITVDSNTLTFSALQTRGDTYYVYDDKGSAHFDTDWEHRELVNISYIYTSGLPLLPHWCVCNSPDLDWYDLHEATSDYHIAYARRYLGTQSFYLAEYDESIGYSDYYDGFGLSTTYYMTLERDEGIGTYGTLYEYICTGNYYGESGSNLVDTLAVTLHEKADFQYIYTLMSYDTGDQGYSASGYVEDLDLQEGPPPEAVGYSFGYIIGG